MNAASELLKKRSHGNLMSLALQVDQDLSDANTTETERKHTLALGRAMFSQVNALLKATLDTEDLPTFTKVEREWARMFDEVWLPEAALDDMDGPGIDETPAGVRELVRYRATLRLGLAMWAAHLLAGAGGDTEAQPMRMRVDALRILSGRFETVDGLLNVYERASEREEREERIPWTDWFLSELPAGEGHMIPTQSELLFATVLLSTLIVPADPPALSPRSWLAGRDEEIIRALARLDEQAARWSVLIPAPALDTDLRVPDPQDLGSWHERVALVRGMFAQLKADSEADELEKLRAAPLDETRVADFRSHLLASTQKARLIRETFVRQATVEHLTQPPEEHVPMVSTSWMPKSFFSLGSNVVGVDMAASDLARVTARAEIDQLLAALSQRRPPASDTPLIDEVKAAIARLRTTGRRPSLVIIPLGWELRRALGLQRLATLAEAHPLIPLTHRRDFEGFVDGVPVIDFPQVPENRLWVLDLAAAARFDEWPSDDGSGIRFELRSFDEDQAEAMLAEHPEVRGEGRTDEQAIHDLQERLLLTLTMCWQITVSQVDATIPIEIPPALRRKRS